MAATALVAAAEVHVNGDPLAPEDLREVRVEHHLLLPDSFSLRLADPLLEHVDAPGLAPGRRVEISFAGPTGGSLVPVFSGEIAAVEPEFTAEAAVLAVRGYDDTHRLNRTPRTEAYQQVSYADIARKLIGAAGLRTGRIDPTPGTQPFVQQSNETDWRFLWRLAATIDYMVILRDGKVDFRPAGGPAAGAGIELVWGQTLRELRPRITGIQQVDSVTVRGWDPKAKQAINATAKVSAVDGETGLMRKQVAKALRGGEVTLAERAVTSQAEARALAESTAERVGNAYLEAEGAALGDPRIRAGAQLSIDGVGSRFGGTYRVSTAVHVHRGARGYETRFVVSGRSTRTLLDLMAPPAQRSWTEGLVVGVVTNNSDPDGLGRVRVRYPTLGDELESWWARIATVSAGRRRGVLMMPVPGDEVVIGFEHGDTRRPYVLGAVHNGRDTPGELVHPDGSLAVRSDKEIVLESVGKLTVTSGQDAALTVNAHQTEDVAGNSSRKAKGNVAIEAGGALTLEGKAPSSLKSSAPLTIESSATLTIKASGALNIQCAGTVRIAASQIMLG